MTRPDTATPKRPRKPRTPWLDMKAAFYCPNPERLWRAHDGGKVVLPRGWHLIETDCSGARCVAVVRCDHFPTIEEAQAVKASIQRYSRLT